MLTIAFSGACEAVYLVFTVKNIYEQIRTELVKETWGFTYFSWCHLLVELAVLLDQCAKFVNS